MIGVPRLPSPVTRPLDFRQLAKSPIRTPRRGRSVSLSFVSICGAVRGMNWASITPLPAAASKISFDLQASLLDVAAQGASNFLVDRLLSVVV